MVDPTFGYAFNRRANEKVLLVAAFSTKQERWLGMKCVNIHSGKQYRMVDYTKVSGAVRPPFDRISRASGSEESCTGWFTMRGEHQRSFKACSYRGWRVSLCGQGNRSQVFKTTEYGRSQKVVADTSIADEIRAIGMRKTMDLTKMSQHTIEKLIRGEAVKRETHEHVLKAIQAYK